MRACTLRSVSAVGMTLRTTCRQTVLDPNELAISCVHSDSRNEVRTLMEPTRCANVIFLPHTGAHRASQAHRNGPHVLERKPTCGNTAHWTCERRTAML